MTLNEAANLTKKALAYFVLFLILYMVGEYLIKGSNYIYDKAFPLPGSPPTISFGKIDVVDIATLPVDLSEAEYRKELPVVGFPEFPSAVRVYEIEQPTVSVAKEENAIQIARNLGFNTPPIKVSDSERLWRNLATRSEFRVDVFYETHKLSTDANFLEATLIRGETPSKSQAVDVTREYLTTTGSFDEDLEYAEYTVVGTELIEGVKKKTDLPPREQLKYVNVVPKKVSHTTISGYKRNGEPDIKDNYIKVFTNSPVISNINTYVGKTGTSTNDLKVTDGTYNYYNTTGNYGTYPIISADEAWNLLLENKSSLVFIREDGADYFAPSSSVSNVKTIDIRSMELAYYMPTNISKYLQPIYVFSGKYTTANRVTGDIVFYLPALSSVVDSSE
jgi:hypothetical protein